VIQKVISIQYSGYFFDNLNYKKIRKISEEKEKLRIENMFKEKSQKIQPILEGGLINILV
jgi:hypothetical protein